MDYNGFLLPFLFTLFLSRFCNGQTTGLSPASSSQSSTAAAIRPSPYPTADSIVEYDQEGLIPLLVELETNATEIPEAILGNGSVVTEADILESNVTGNEDPPRLQDLLETEAGQRWMLERMTGEMTSNETSQGGEVFSLEKLPTDTNTDAATDLTTTMPTSQIPLTRLNQQDMENVSAADIYDATLPFDIDIVDEVKSVTETDSIGLSTTNKQDETPMLSDATVDEYDSQNTPQVPTSSDVIQNKQDNMPEGKLNDVLVTTTTEKPSTADNSPNKTHYQINQLQNHHESFEQSSTISIITGVVLALVGASVIFAIFLFFRRQRLQIKRKLMINFDIDRLHFWGLRHQPSNVQIIDFPIRHDDDSWHDVKPVTSSVV